MGNNEIKKGWSIAFWILLVAWIIGAALNTYRAHGSFFTNYLADLTFPPWFYIFIRNLGPAKRKALRPFQWFGRTPSRAFISIFLVGVITEVSSNYWPNGIFRGTFDYWDIVAYAVGLSIAWYFDEEYH
jgi:hypothetical protein